MKLIRIQKRNTNTGKISIALIVTTVGILLAFIFAVGFFMESQAREEYTQKPAPAITITIDSIQKLTNNIAKTTRQMNADEQQLLRAIETVENAKAILASSTQSYNDAIESFELYQGIQ